MQKLRSLVPRKEGFKKQNPWADIGSEDQEIFVS